MKKNRVLWMVRGLTLAAILFFTTQTNAVAEEAVYEAVSGEAEIVAQEGITSLAVQNAAKNGTEVTAVKLTADGLKPPTEGATVASCTPDKVVPVSGQNGIKSVRGFWTDFRPDKNGGSGYNNPKPLTGSFGPLRDENGDPAYRFFIEILLDDAYEFPKAYQSLGIRQFGEVLTLNDTPVAFGAKYHLLEKWLFLCNNEADPGKIYAYIEVRDEALTPIERIELTETGLTEPVPGKTAADMPVVTFAPSAKQIGMYDITDEFWVDHENISERFTGTFEEGKRYYYFVKLKAREGYYLSENIETEYPSPWETYVNGERIGADESRYQMKTEGLAQRSGTYDVHLYLKKETQGGDTGDDNTGEETGKGAWERAGKRWRYRYADGTYAKGDWAKIDGRWYHFDADGYMQTGWLKLAAWYYLGTDGAMQTGWQKIDGKWYYFNRYGGMLTGWVKSGGRWYYMNRSGAMATGWVKDGGKWYYMNSSGAMQTGWVRVGNTWYYINSSGAMQTGWLKSGGKWYYLKSSGAMATGWTKVGNQWYYMSSSGVMQTGWVKLSGKWYYLDSSGAMLANTSRKIGSRTYRFNASGVCTNP